MRCGQQDIHRRGNIRYCLARLNVCLWRGRERLCPTYEVDRRPGEIAHQGVWNEGLRLPALTRGSESVEGD